MQLFGEFLMCRMQLLIERKDKYTEEYSITWSLGGLYKTKL